MKTSFHLCRKDLQRLWVPIVLFGTVIASKLMLGTALLWRLDGIDNLQFNRIGLYVNLAALMEFFVGYVIAAAIVHEDVLVGTTAFWMTKPISGVRLLSGKLLTLVLVFVVLPTVVTLPWWVACELPPHDLVLAAFAVVAPFALIGLIGVTVATMTANFSRFFVWTIAMLAALPILVTTRWMRAWSVWGEAAHRSTGARDTAYALTAIVIVAGLAAVIIHQYRTRRFWQSCGVLAGTLLFGFAFSPWWRWDLSDLFDRTNPAPITTQVGSVEISKIAARNFAAAKVGDLRTELTVRGIPPGHLVVPTQLDATLRWPNLTHRRPNQLAFAVATDGTLLPTLLNLPPAESAPVEQMLRRASRRAHDAGISYRPNVPTPAEPNTMRVDYSTRISPSLVARIEKDAPSYSADLSFRLCKLDLAAESPLVAGQVLALDRYRARIVRKEILETGELEFGVIERQGPSHRRGSTVGAPSFELGDTLVDGSFVLVNRAKGNFVAINSTGAQSLSISGVLITWRLLKTRAPAHWDPTTSRFEPDANWFDEASIIATRQRPIAELRHHLELDPAQVAAALAKAEDSSEIVAPDELH